jgi:hypothetical protein
MKKSLMNFRNLVGILLISIFGIFLMTTTGCEKDESSGGSSQDCNCGSIASFDYDANGYYVRVKNYCSGNYKWFGMSSSDWYAAEYGDKACANSSWKSSNTAIPNIPIGREATSKEQTGEYIE